MRKFSSGWFQEYGYSKVIFWKWNINRKTIQINVQKAEILTENVPVGMASLTPLLAPQFSGLSFVPFSLKQFYQSVSAH